MKRTSSLLRTMLLVLVGGLLLVGAHGGTKEEEEAKRNAIELKTAPQLKKFLKELDVSVDPFICEEELREVAYEENAVERWLEIHPEKRKYITDPDIWNQIEDGDFSNLPSWAKKMINGIAKKEIKKLAALSGRTEADEQTKRRNIKLLTVGQLKKIFEELEIDIEAFMDKEELLRELAYEENAVERWLEFYAERRKSFPITDPECWDILEALRKTTRGGVRVAGDTDLMLRHVERTVWTRSLSNLHLKS